MKFLSILLLGITTQIAHASWDPKPIPFPAPSYIDLDFDKLDFSAHFMDSKYSKQRLYHQLISQYYQLPPSRKGLTWQERETLSTQAVDQFIKEVKEIYHHLNITFDEQRWQPLKKAFGSSSDIMGVQEDLKRIKAFLAAVTTEIKETTKAQSLIELRCDLTHLSYADEPHKKELQERINGVKKDPTLSLFAQYLEIVFCFETQQHDQAFSLLKALKETLEKEAPTTHSWLKETTNYLIPRLLLILSQQVWDGYSAPDGKINLDLLQQAEANFDLYLKMYPDGLYHASATHIKRRIHMLRGEREKLSHEIRKRVNDIFAATPLKSLLIDDFDGLMTEIKFHLHEELDFAKDHPLLLAYALLYNNKIEVKDLENLQKNKDHFQDFPELFTFLETHLLYHLQRYQEVVNQTANLTPPSHFLIKSRWVLRAKAQDHLNHDEEALKSWRDLYTLSPEDMVAIEIYKVLIKLNRAHEIFDIDQNIKNENLLAAMVEGAPTIEQLEGLLNKASIPTSTKGLIATELLKRHLLMRHYTDFIKIWTMTGDQNLKLEDKIPYKDIIETIKTLVQSPTNQKGMLALARFINEYFESTISHEPDYGQLEVMIPGLQGKRPWISQYISPFTTFQEVANQCAKSPLKNDEEAEALHHLVMCFKQGSHERRCHLGNIPPNTPKDVSKKSFQKLHKKYGNTTWAKQTPYYYGS